MAKPGGNDVTQLFGNDAPPRLDWRAPADGVDPVVDRMRDELYALIYDNFGEIVLSRFELRYGNITGLRIGCLRYWSDRIKDKVSGEDSQETVRRDGWVIGEE